MPRYVVLVNWTDQGIKNVKHTTERMDHGGELAEKHGFDAWREVVGAEGTSRR